MNSTICAPNVADNVVINSEFFSDVASRYAHVSGLVDALVKSENPAIDLATAESVISDLRIMANSGRGYTPDKSLGFGSDNAGTIAEKILGLSKTTSQVRKLFRKVGAN